MMAFLILSLNYDERIYVSMLVLLLGVTGICVQKKYYCDVDKYRVMLLAANFNFVVALNTLMIVWVSCLYGDINGSGCRSALGLSILIVYYRYEVSLQHHYECIKGVKGKCVC